MSFVVTQVGQLLFLQAITSSTLNLHLYVNNHTPSKTDVISNYQELVFTGYGPKFLIPGNWTYAIDNLTGNYVASYTQQVWPFNAMVTVYGYYLTDSSNTNLILAERFPTAPIMISTNGGNIKVTPTIGSGSCG